MRSYDELFEQYKNKNSDGGYVLYKEMFKAVIEEHDKEMVGKLINIINKKIRKAPHDKHLLGYLRALGELKAELEKK